MTLSKTKIRRAATRGLSVGLSATTSLWLVGSSVFLAVPAAHASNDAVVSDITSSNPRIAPNGESELAVLGVNIQMDVNPTNVDKRLQSVVVQLKSDDAAGNGEAALANIERSFLYSDSGLSGTGGQFDTQDPLVDTATRTVAAAMTGLINNAAGYAAAATSIDVDTIAGTPCVDDDDSNSATNPCTAKFGTGLTSEIRNGSYENDDAAAGGACATGVGANTCFLLDVATAFAHPDNEAFTQKKLQIANADISNSGNVAAAQEGFAIFAAAGTGPLHTGYEGAAIFGDTNRDAAGDILTFTPPTVDTGNDAGNDLFVTFLTAGGAANQTFVAAIWPDENAAERVRIQLHDIGAAAAGDIAVNSNTTNNESKTVTMGADNVAPSIQSAKMFDNDADGNVDRVEVKFNESMGNSVTATTNFVTAIGTAVAGNVGAVASVPATNDDADLAAVGTWVTGTVLRDTLRIDFQGDNPHAVADNCGITGNVEPDPVATYCNATASTGDNFSVVYDRDNATVAADNLADASGTPLEDVTITSTDAARPVFMTPAQALPGTFATRDNNGDAKIDEIRLTASEAWGSASTASGLELRRTDVNPNVIYTLGAVNGFLTSAGTAADANGNAITNNANDTIRIAVTQQAGTDVTGVFQVNYTAASTLVDAATVANEARSITGMAAVAGIVPVVQQAWIVDINNAVGGADIDGAADADGTIDGLVVIFNSNVEVDQTGALGNPALSDMALSGGYAFAAAAPLDEDNDQLLVFPITQAAAPVADTDVTPDWTYNNDGAADGALCAFPSAVGNACANANDVQVESVTSSTVVEQNRSGARLMNANFYETTADDIWQTGETMVLTFSENVDPASFRTSYTNDALLNGPSDFGWAIGNGANAMPNNVTVSVSGRVVTITATESATATLAAVDTVMVGANEIYDTQGNASPGPVTGGGVISAFMGGGAEQSLAPAVVLNVTPAVAPAVLRIDTHDANNNGILDSFVVELGGLINPASITMSQFHAARGADFAVNTLGTVAPFCGGGAAGDNRACANQDVVPDLTITSVATMNGGNDSRLLVSYTEAGENSGARPQLSYVQGSLADLAANKIATFNASAADNTKLDLNITNGAGDFPARDGVAPKVVYKFLKDRDGDKMIDQLVLVFSETILNGAGTLVNGVLTSQGWVVAGKGLAANGATINNTDYQAYTFTTVSPVWQADVTEGSSQDVTIPGVSYTSSGNFRDAGGNVLGSVAAGGEATNITGATPPPSAMMDGDLFKGASTSEVWIAKHIGVKLFKRHVLSSVFDTFYPHLAPFWSHVSNVSDATVAAHSLSAWIRLAGDTKVWEVNGDGTKHWISCADDSVAGQNCANEWTASGRDSDGIYTVNSAEANSYTVGPTVIMPDQPN